MGVPPGIWDQGVRFGAIATGSVTSWWYSVGVFAQSLPSVDATLVSFLEKGGTAAVLVVVLWAYRRDYKRLTDAESARSQQLITLMTQQAVAVEAQSRAATQVAVALAENREMLRQLSLQIHERLTHHPTTGG